MHILSFMRMSLLIVVAMLSQDLLAQTFDSAQWTKLKPLQDTAQLVDNVEYLIPFPQDAANYQWQVEIRINDKNKKKPQIILKNPHPELILLNQHVLKLANAIQVETLPQMSQLYENKKTKIVESVRQPYPHYLMNYRFLSRQNQFEPPKLDLQQLRYVTAQYCKVNTQKADQPLVDLKAYIDVDQMGLVQVRLSDSEVPSRIKQVIEDTIKRRKFARVYDVDKDQYQAYQYMMPIRLLCAS